MAIKMHTSYKVKGFRAALSLHAQQHLMSMGLAPGRHFTVMQKAPLGDPYILYVQGTRISVRKSLLEDLILEAVDER